MIILYKIGLQLYFFCLHLGALFGHKKARRYVDALRTYHIDHQEFAITNTKRAWFHAASAGEWLQLSPLAHKMSTDGWQVIVSFFSPSAIPFIEKEGFQFFMLPPDYQSNAIKMYRKVQPDIFITARYEFWPVLMGFLKTKSIPSVLLNAYVNDSNSSWKKFWWGKYLHYLSLVCCIDEATARFLKNRGGKRVCVTGDTKVEVEQNKVLPIHLQNILNDRKVFICGSAHKKETSLLLNFLKLHGQEFHEWLWLIVPHEPSLEEFTQLSKDHHISYADSGEIKMDSPVLYINQVGILSALYRYSSIAFVGGGWDKGVHNVPEAAIHGNVVIFGPGYQNFPEAELLVKDGCAFSVQEHDEFGSVLLTLLNDPQRIALLGSRAKIVTNSMRGATDRCYSEIKMLLN